MSKLGFQVLEWDILKGPQFDLMVSSNRSRVRGWILSGATAAVHIGTPCKSWSRARDRPGGPPPLRSNSEVWGLPGLSPGDQLKVHVGNTLARFSMSVMFAARFANIACSLENPASSRLWITPPAKRLLTSSRVSDVVSDFCQWGTSWLKPTRIVGVCLDLSRLARRCNFRSNNFVCSRSGCRHQQLCGQAEGGKFWTEIAEAYPKPFARALALALSDAVTANLARNFSLLLNGR
jgi:hypothetical protein